MKCLVAIAVLAACGAPVAAPRGTPPHAVNRTPPTAYADQARTLLAAPHAVESRERALDSFMRGCDAGDLSACEVILGNSLFKTAHYAAHKRAGAAMYASCRRGDFRSCRLAEDSAAIEFDVDEMKRACEDGLGGACYELTLGSKQPTHDLLVKGCEHGSLRSCESLAKTDPAWNDRRQQLLQRGCDAGYEFDRFKLSEDFDAASETALVLTRKESAASRVRCLRGIAEACRGAIGQTQLDALVTKRMYCVLDPMGCDEFAELVSSGDVPKDLVSARWAYESSCVWSEAHQSQMRDCAAAAKLYLQDLAGAPADPKRAAELAKQACQLGDAASCPPK